MSTTWGQGPTDTCGPPNAAAKLAVGDWIEYIEPVYNRRWAPLDDRHDRPVELENRITQTAQAA